MNLIFVTNPFANTLTGPVLLVLAALFGGGGTVLTGLSFVRRYTPICFIAPGFAATDMLSICWQRYRTWFIIAALFAGAVLSGPLPLLALCALLCLLGGREYAALTGLDNGWQWLLVGGGWLTLVATFVSGPQVLTIAPVFAIFASFGLALHQSPSSQGFRNLLSGLWGYFYIGWLPAHLLALDSHALPSLVLLVGLGVALSDVGAFCMGKILRGPKLAPKLSPSKTWGGVAGNLLGAALAIALFGSILPPLDLLEKGLLVLAIGLGSVWGDLVESLLKRQRGVKDAGALLPGFGGVLDRVDSLLLVAPLVFYCVQAFGA